jgi:hypothetical protein
LVALPAAAQTERGRGKQPRDAAQAAALFADAASTYEDIINLVLSNRTGAMHVTIGSARGVLTRLRPSLTDWVASTLDRQLKEMETAEASQDLISTALTAAESFKHVNAAMNPRMRRMPVEASMYTYWGFRLAVLSLDTKVNWPEVALAVTESERSWTQLRGRVRDANLRILLEENQHGLREAAARNDTAGVKLGARVQIASAAVLRDFFDRASAMARARR